MLRMKAKTIQIVWHSKEPVWTLDFHPSGLLATGGADKEIKVCETSLTESHIITLRRPASHSSSKVTLERVETDVSALCLQFWEVRAEYRRAHANFFLSVFHLHTRLCFNIGCALQNCALQVKQDEADNPSVTHVGTLANHGKTVNCVRFSPTGWMCQQALALCKRDYAIRLSAALFADRQTCTDCRRTLFKRCTDTVSMTHRGAAGKCGRSRGGVSVEAELRRSPCGVWRR